MSLSGVRQLEQCCRKLITSSPMRVKLSHLHTQRKLSAFMFNNYCSVRHSSHIIKSPFKDIEISNKLIPEIVWEAVDRFPENTALKCGLTGRTYTYSELQKLSCRFANSLLKAGFTRGDVIAVILSNSPEFPIVVLGALEAGLSLSLINFVYTADEMCHQMTDSGSVGVVTGPEQLANVTAAISKLEAKNQSSRIRRLILNDIPSLEVLPGGVTRLSEMIGSSVDSSPIKSQPNGGNDHLAFLPYSSGTTGLPKGVCLSHRNIVTNIQQVSSIDGYGIHSPNEGQDLVLGILPFYHTYGLTLVLMLPLANGGQVITLPKFEPDSFISTMESEKLSILMLVPPLILFLTNSERVTSKHLAHVRYLASGAAPIGSSDLVKLEKKWPSYEYKLKQAYGMTELSPAATLTPSHVNDLATIGVPAPNTMAKIIDPDTGVSLGCNEDGELCIKGPQVMMGYHNNPTATSNTIDSEGWLRTGDLAYYNEENYLYIKDRLKELIKVKGFQVAPAELEEILRTHPSITDTAVIGVPCPKDGETPVAFVVVKKDKKLGSEDVKNFLSDKVTRYKQVSEVIFVDTIPKSAAGKILRKDLKQTFKK